MDDLNRVRELAGLPLTESYNVEDNNQVNEAGGHYTQPVYDMIEKHGIDKVMHELLTSLDADTIQDFISRADLDETTDEEIQGL